MKFKAVKRKPQSLGEVLRETAQPWTPSKTWSPDVKDRASPGTWESDK